MCWQSKGEDGLEEPYIDESYLARAEQKSPDKEPSNLLISFPDLEEELTICPRMAQIYLG